MLLALGPYIDQAVSNHWILDYSWTPAAVRQLAVSCGLAVLVNISQFMCLGRFSAVTFQVCLLSSSVLVCFQQSVVCCCPGADAEQRHKQEVEVHNFKRC